MGGRRGRLRDTIDDARAHARLRMGHDTTDSVGLSMAFGRGEASTGGAAGAAEAWIRGGAMVEMGLRQGSRRARRMQCEATAVCFVWFCGVSRCMFRSMIPSVCLSKPRCAALDTTDILTAVVVAI